MSDTMQGVRVDHPPEVADDQYPFPFLKSGQYGKHRRGTWYCIPPNRDPFGFVGNLSRHDIVEHEDGTITVSPSILITVNNVGEWHGYLEKGMWREC